MLGPLGAGVAVIQEDRAWDHGEETLKKLIRRTMLKKETEDLALSTFAKTKATALGFYWGNLVWSMVLPIAPVASLVGLAVGYGFDPKAKEKAIRETVKEGRYPKAGTRLSTSLPKADRIGAFSTVPLFTVSDSMTEPTVSENIPQILKALKAADGEFPRQAILDARECREAITPELLRIIRDEFDLIKKGNPPSDVRSLIAFFILLEFRIKELLPLLVEMLHLPDPVPYDFFGDIITEEMAQILWYLGADEATLDSLIRDRNADEFVRWEALQCLAFFVKDGRWTREELCIRLHSYLKESLETDDKNLITSLISELVDCGAVEAQDDIDLAFDQNMVNLFMYRRDHIPESLKDGAAHFAERLEEKSVDYSDCIVEIEQWCCFGEDEPEPPPRSLPSYAPWSNGNGLFDDFDEERPHVKVGRNDPCPCGSGKKYKKCCMK